MEDEEPLLAKERQSRQETLSIHPITVTRVIKRCRALATDLVPIPIKDGELFCRFFCSSLRGATFHDGVFAEFAALLS